MRRMHLAVGMLLAGILSVPAFAQNTTEPQGQGAHQRKGARPGGDPAAFGRMRVDQQVERLTKELTLTQDQQEKVRKLITDHQKRMGEQMRKTMTENGDKLRDLRKQIEEARAAKDADKLKTLEAQRRELMGEAQMTAAREKLMTDIAGVLTAEQKPKFAQIKDEVFGWGPSVQDHPELLMKAVESLKLASDKEQKIKGIVDEWKTKYRPGKDREAAEKNREAARTAAADVYKKVMAELTPEEQAKVKAWRPEPGMGMMGGHGPGDAPAGEKGHKGHKRGEAKGTDAPAAETTK